MTNYLIEKSFNGTPVFFQTNAFINATNIAATFNKKPDTYLKTKRTKAYINALGKVLFTDALKSATKQNQLVTVVQGGKTENQGTWLHPKLAIDFARWLNPDFAVWCDMQIENILHPIITTPQTISESEALQVKKAIQSICKADRNKYSDTYNKIYEYYGITSYKNIPEGKAKEAVDLIHGELLPLKKVGEQSGPFYSLDEIFKHSENRVSKELHEYKQRILIIINDGVPTITFIPNDIMMISEEDIPEMVSFYMPTYRLVKKEKIKNVEKMISELTGAK